MKRLGVGIDEWSIDQCNEGLSIGVDPEVTAGSHIGDQIATECGTKKWQVKQIAHNKKRRFVITSPVD